MPPPIAKSVQTMLKRIRRTLEQGLSLLKAVQHTSADKLPELLEQQDAHARKWAALRSRMASARGRLAAGALPPQVVQLLARLDEMVRVMETHIQTTARILAIHRTVVTTLARVTQNYEQQTEPLAWIQHTVMAHLLGTPAGAGTSDRAAGLRGVGEALQSAVDATLLRCTAVSTLGAQVLLEAAAPPPPL